MTHLEQIAAVVTEQMASNLPPARFPEEQQIINMIKKASYAAFIIGYKTARDSISKDLKSKGLLDEEQALALLKDGDTEMPAPKENT